MVWIRGWGRFLSQPDHQWFRLIYFMLASLKHCTNNYLNKCKTGDRTYFKKKTKHDCFTYFTPGMKTFLSILSSFSFLYINQSKQKYTASCLRLRRFSHIMLSVSWLQQDLDIANTTGTRYWTSNWQLNTLIPSFYTVKHQKSRLASVAHCAS